MSQKIERNRKKFRKEFLIAVLSFFLAVVIGLLSFVIVKITNKPSLDNNTDKNSSIVSSENVSSEQKIDPDAVVAQATVVNTGDIILHSTVLDGAKLGADEYDFSAFFIQADDYFKAANLATANLEVTLGGKESGPFSGYPAFNAPDSLLDDIKNGGINFLTTANNHCYDTGLFGLKRTVSQLKLAGIDFVGTKETSDDPTYVIKDVNGIKLGITTFTYENTAPEGSKSINGNVVKPEANELINSFSYDRINEFYVQAQSVITDMENSGAEAVVFYMHWGEEYQLSPNTWQKSIAQKLSNMGVDVIVGGHPHVVQPIELIHSEDSENTTVCIYSMGNAISNQRQELMDDCPSGHTEDGMLFYYTFEKYGDGTVKLSGVDIIPTWVLKYRGDTMGGWQYTMYPLETADKANEYFDSATASKAKKSFERTKAIVSQGLTECQEYLGCEVRFEIQEAE